MFEYLSKLFRRQSYGDKCRELRGKDLSATIQIRIVYVMHDWVMYKIQYNQKGWLLRGDTCKNFLKQLRRL